MAHRRKKPTIWHLQISHKMAGLRKAKKYDWKDSNLALFGSDTEKQVKKESAQSEPAWQGAGEAVGLKIWRIVKFKVEDWPKEDYGKFYNGDSYIILHTYKEDGSDELLYDVHFWIGAESSQDEYGTAAYKTVELDTFLDDKPVQHREVQGHESAMFKSYFTSIEILEGGAESGFRHVKPTEYKPRLLHVSGTRKSVEVRQVPMSSNRLVSGDVFILDLGLKVYQWNGSEANKDEKFKAVQFLQKLKSERSGKADVETIEEADVSKEHEFYAKLTEDDVEEEAYSGEGNKELFQLSDASGQMTFQSVKNSDITIADFKSQDVFILDTKKILFVWIGKSASNAENKNAMSYAHNYLMKTSYPLIPVSCLPEGRRNKDFEAAIAA